MKKRTAVIFCLIFLLIPTYFIISFLSSGKQTPINFRDITKTVVVSSNSFVYEIDFDESDPQTTLFFRMFENKEKVASIPKDILKLTPYNVSFISDGYSSDFEYYLTKNADKCYIVRRSGISVNYYRINTELGDEFISSAYCEGIYDNSAIPSVMIDSRYATATSGEWYYQTVSGDYKMARELQIPGEIPDIGSLCTDFSLVFSETPDEITLSVYDKSSGEQLYSGSADGFSSNILDENINVKLVISANYNQGKEAYGSIEYSAYAKLFAPLFFYISEPQVKEGGIVVLTVKNVLEPDSIEFSSEPALESKPVFFKDGDYYRALLPVPMDCVQSNESYKLIIKADRSVKEANLLIMNSDYDSVKIVGVTQETLKAVGVKDQPYTSLYAQISDSIKKNTDFNTLYARGAFSSGYENGIHRSYYGTAIEYTKLPEKVYTSYDHAYVGNQTDAITAMNAGKVVFVGNTAYTGGLIIIEHGYGLLSWYWNIGTVSPDISLGKTVKKGDIIGYNGGGGLSEEYKGKSISCHIALTVFDTPIDEKGLISTGLIIQDK